MNRARAAAGSKRAGRWFGPLLCLAVLSMAEFPTRLASQTPTPSSNGNAAAAPGLSHEADSQAADTPRATLHVYTNLMQVPVLILDSDHQRMKPIPEAKFRVRLDSGPPFKPTHVRREGDDPLELAILIDTSRRDNELLPGIAQAMADLVPGSLRSWDRVSVYVIDCGLIRTEVDHPADSLKLREAIDRGMEGWRERRRQKHWQGCKSSLQLFDAMAFVSGDLMKLQGRRAMLVLTDGVDHGSRNNWNRLMHFDQTSSIAVFGLRSLQDAEDAHLGGFNFRQHPMAAGLGQASVRPEDQFDMICQSSGGVQFTLSDVGLKKGLVRFVEMLRERYIVEYPRSNTATAGTHDLMVTIPDAYAYVRPAGISVPLADQKLLADPMTLPSQAEVPIEGPRRVLAAPAPGSSAPAIPPPPPR